MSGKSKYDEPDGVSGHNGSKEASWSSEKHIQSVFRSAPVGIGVVADRIIKQVNDRLCAMTGYSRRELVGHSARILYPSDQDFEHVGREKYAQIKDHGTGTVETRFRRKNGKVINVLLSSSPIDLDDPSKGVTFTALDITDRKRSEQRLVDETGFQRAIGEIANEFINISSAEIDAGINYALKKAGQFAGADRSYVIRFDFKARTISNTHEWCKAGIEPQIDNLQDMPIEIFNWIIDQLIDLKVVNIPRVAALPEEARNAKNEFEAEGIQSILLVPLISEARCIGTVGYDFVKRTKQCTGREIRLLEMSAATLSNALDRLQTEEALRQSENRYKTLTNNLHIGIYRITPGSTSRFIEANPAIVSIFGYDSRDEFMAMDVVDLYQNPEERQKLNLQIAKNGFVDRFEVALNKKDGTPFVGSVSAVAVKDANGKIIYYDGILEDITGRRELEIQLQQAQKMEAIGALAGGIAHDFNNILAAIIGYTELAINDVETETILHQNLQEVFRAAARAKDLVKQILVFSRQAEQQSKPVLVRLISKEVIKFLRASLPTSIEIRLETNSDSLVMADPTQIHQLMMNLCTNAGHAMGKKGGVLGVKLQDINIEGEWRAKHPELKPVPHLEITISDTGHGIPASVIDRIFDPFFTTKSQGEGTGMGLSVVHGIVASYGGKIVVSSKPGKGTTFKVYLPTVERETAPPPKMGEPIATGRERILFVDDEAALVNIGEQMLNSLGYHVTIRTSSIEALELVKAKADSFDLVITDLAMPNMSGDELAKAIIDIKPDMPIILCTGYSARIDQQQAAAIGIRAFLTKPVLRKDVAKKVREILDDKRP